MNMWQNNNQKECLKYNNTPSSLWLLQRQAGHHGNQPGTAYLQTPVNMTLRDHAWMLEDGRKPSKLAEQSPGGRINAVGLCVVFFAGGPEFNSQV